jgi:hypothetical protein
MDPDRLARLRAAYDAGNSGAFLRAEFPGIADPSHDEVLFQMERMGGTFVSRLAKAWRAADGPNMLKLHAAFGDYYETYKRMAATTPGRSLWLRGRRG